MQFYCGMDLKTRKTLKFVGVNLRLFYSAVKNVNELLRLTKL